MAKKIIGFTGLMAAGKTTAVEYIKEKYGASSHKFSEALRDILNRLYADITRENMQKISQAVRDILGDDVLALAIAYDIKNDENEIILVDGARREADLKYLRKLKDFKLVCINTDEKKRYKRLIDRGENQDDMTKTFEQFQEDQKGEAEAQIPQIMSACDITIDNNGSLEDLHKQLDNLIHEHLKQ